MKKKIRISFIIPVYQVENYITECMESVLKCLQEEDEILFVTKNRSDRSYEICRKYAQNDKRVKVIWQDKTGLSNARNSGLREGKGDYIVFVDGDDYIQASCFEKRRTLLEQVDCRIDVLGSDFVGIDDRGKESFVSHQIKESPAIIVEDYFAEYSAGLSSYWNVWRYFYRREFLEKEDLYFLEGIRNEDVDFTTRVLLRAKKIGYYHEPYYCYRIRRKGALTTRIEKDHIRDLLYVIENGMRCCKKEGGAVSKYLEQKLLREYIWNLPFLYEVPKVQRKDVYALYKNTQYLLKEHRGKGKLVGIIRMLGIQRSGYLLYILKKIRRKIKGI